MLADRARIEAYAERHRAHAPERADGPRRRRRESLREGCLILAGEESAPIRLIASGSEVQLALAARDLPRRGRARCVAVVSMPSGELFATQDDTYRAKVMGGDGTIRIACEAATGFGWERWLGSKGASSA